MKYKREPSQIFSVIKGGNGQKKCAPFLEIGVNSENKMSDLSPHLFVFMFVVAFGRLGFGRGFSFGPISLIYPGGGHPRGGPILTMVPGHVFKRGPVNHQIPEFFS